MKVKDLLNALKGVDPEMLVFCTSNTGEYEFCIVQSAHVAEICVETEPAPSDEDEESDVQDVFLIQEQ